MNIYYQVILLSLRKAIHKTPSLEITMHISVFNSYPKAHLDLVY